MSVIFYKEIDFLRDRLLTQRDRWITTVVFTLLGGLMAMSRDIKTMLLQED